ncbi:MAG: hypothetical protein CL916_01660 [Deltaproteobacteria bacterium]|nr:hypothetical protein [Deltaproteobacteria bacterium]
MFFLVFLCTIFASPESDFIGIPQSQLTQEMIPLLERELAILEKRVQVKKEFFAREKKITDAFWEFSGIDLFDSEVRNAQINTIGVQYQKRLTQTFHKLVDKEIKPEVSKLVAELVEKKWNAENDRDTLNLRMLQIISQRLEQHVDFVEQLKSIKIENRQLLGHKVDPANTNVELAHAVAQKKYIQQLKKGLIRLWFHSEHETIDKTVQELISDVDVQDWSLDRQKKTLLIFSHWQTGQKQQFAQRIKALNTKQSQQKQAEIEKKWVRIQKDWKPSVSKLEEGEAKEEKEIVQKKITSLPDDALPLQKEILVYQLDVLNDHIEHRSTLRNEAQLRESQERLDQAKQKELQAKQSADQKRIQQEVVRLREIETLLRKNELKRHTSVQDYLEEAKIERSAIDAIFIEWKELPPLASNKDERLQEHTKRVYDYKKSIQEQILTLDNLVPIDSKSTVEQDLSVQQALGDIEHALRDRSQNIQQEKQNLYTLWISMNEYEVRTKHHDMRSVDGQMVWEAVQFEGSHLSLALGEHLSRAKGWFTDINHILDLVQIFFGGGVLAVCWLWSLRRLVPGWLWIRTWLRNQDRLYVPRTEDVESEIQKWKSVIHQMYYLFSALILHSFLYGSVFRIFSSIIVFFVGMRLVSALAHTWKDSMVDYQQLQRSISMFVIVFLGLNILEDGVQSLFFAYQGAVVVQWMQNVILVLFFAVQLRMWGTFWEEKSDQTVGLITLKKIRNHLSKGIIGSRLRAVLSLIIISFDAMGRVIFWCIEHSSLFGSTLARNALEETATKHEGLLAFESQKWGFDNARPLESYKDIILQSMADWKRDQKRGSIVITADEGMGKSHLMTLIKDEEYDIPIHSFLTEDIERNEYWNRLTVLRWIACSLEVDPDGIHTTQDVIETLKKRESTIFFLDNVHHVFLRIVEGFVVLDTLFTIIQETSNRHCWVLTCHLPTWRFITSPATPIQSNFFRTEVQIVPWSVQQLQETMKNYVEEKEYKLDFSSLTTLKNPQSVHRAQMSYWRLLSDASKGNPSTAFELFLLSLFQDEGKESKTLLIKLFPLLKTTEIQKLDDMSCFVLSSIVLHQEIQYSELCRSLQIGSEIIQSICKNLVDMDIVILKNQEYTVRSIWYPWVERVLIQKRFISMRL